MNSKTHQAAAASVLMSSSVLRSVMDGHRKNDVATRAVHQLLESGIATRTMTVRRLVWRCDRWLSLNHRNDHVYRKALVAQMKLPKPCVFMPEFRAGDSIVDYLAVSESLHAVEIKSDLDNLSRLPSQIEDYRRIAPKVSLLGTKRSIQSVEANRRYSAVGLAWLDERGRVQFIRPAERDTRFLDPVVLMRSLRRDEYLQVLSDLGVSIPDLPNTRIFSFVREIVRDMDPETYLATATTQLRKRAPKAGRSAIDRIPAPLMPNVLRIDPSRNRLNRLREWLEEEIQNVYA